MVHRRATAGGTADGLAYTCGHGLYLLGEPAVRACRGDVREFGPRVAAVGGRAMRKTGCEGEVASRTGHGLLRRRGGTAAGVELGAMIPRTVLFTCKDQSGATIEGGADDPVRVLEIWTARTVCGPPTPDSRRRAACRSARLLGLVRTPTEPPPGVAALARARVVDACYASADEGREITLA